MKKYGIPVLTTVLPGKLSETSTVLEDAGLSFPLIAKPRKGRGSRDVYRLDSPGDLVLLNRIEDPIIQEFASGEEYVVIMFCIRDRVVDTMTRKKIALKGGVPYQCEFAEEQSLVDYSKKIAESMLLFGPVHIQWFLSDRGGSSS